MRKKSVKWPLQQTKWKDRIFSGQAVYLDVLFTVQNSRLDNLYKTQLLKKLFVLFEKNKTRSIQPLILSRFSLSG